MFDSGAFLCCTAYGMPWVLKLVLSISDFRIDPILSVFRPIAFQVWAQLGLKEETTRPRPVFFATVLLPSPHQYAARN